MSKTGTFKIIFYCTLIVSIIFASPTKILAKISFCPLKACRLCNDIAPLLTSQPNAQQITREHQVTINLPLSENKKILFIQDEHPGFYLYKQQKYTLQHERQTYTCIIGKIDLKSCDQGSVKKHELTLADKACDLEVFIETQKAEFNPVLLIYNKELPVAAQIQTIINDYAQKLPAQSFMSSDGIHHSIWQIDNTEDVEKLQAFFTQIPTVYVADGHHRLAVAQNLRKKNTSNTSFDYMLAALASSDDAILADFNRVIKNISITPDKLKTQLSSFFEIKKINAQDAQPTQLHTFGMYVNKTWYQLTAKPEILENKTNNSPEALDMHILHTFIIDPLLAAKNPETKIEYLGGIKNAHELEEKCTSINDIAFAVFPVPMDQFMGIIDTGKLMPPKTTWFEPKLPPGLIVYSLH